MPIAAPTNLLHPLKSPYGDIPRSSPYPMSQDPGWTPETQGIIVTCPMNKPRTNGQTDGDALP